MHQKQLEPSLSDWSSPQSTTWIRLDMIAFAPDKKDASEPRNADTVLGIVSVCLQLDPCSKGVMLFQGGLSCCSMCIAKPVNHAGSFS